MKKEFIVERQGKMFVLYAGLLNLAHEHGLKAIKTELIQIPREDNNRIAICLATVVMEKDGVESTFTGIGDAAANNVAPAMATALIRMAETRAKARALRDAVNVGVTAFEELGDPDATDHAPERGYRTGAPTRPRASDRPTPTLASPAPRPFSIEAPALVGATAGATTGATNGNGKSSGNGSEGGVTEQQITAIRNISQSKKIDPEVMAKEKYGVDSLPELTQAQAGEFIKSMNEKAR